MKPLLTIKNVSFAYDQTTVVKNLDFVIHSGDYLCIIGENGSGKSTLIKGILQLKQPLTGEIIFDESLKPDEIGYLPQQTIIQKDFPASVYEVVLSGCLNQCGLRPFYNRREKQRAKDMMTTLGIDHLKHRCYRELSGGQQQRVLLARALCATKKILLLDEPMAGLDPVVTQELYELISKINREIGITIVMISHDLSNSFQYATHVLHLKDGQSFYATTERYLQTDHLWESVRREQL